MVLSDYGVEVKTVPTGLDVLTVAQSFKPDIVLADVLLTKKNGYEVCQELKAHNDTKAIPVVLMWSSFIQLDQNLYQQTGASGSIEKPFDTDTIRRLIESLVPKLQTFPLKGFLNHPPLPDFEESDTFVRQKNDFSTQKLQTPTSENPQSNNSTPPATATTEPSALARENEEIEEFQYSSPPAREQQSVVREPTDDWSPTKATQFVIETESHGDFEEVKVINSREAETPDLQKKIQEQIQNYIKDSPVAVQKSQSAFQTRQAYSSFDEQLIREEIRQTAERICWQVIPEITEKIVREELNKLMQEIEKNI